MLRFIALVQVAVLLAACGAKPSYAPGIYASIDYAIDAPNPIVSALPRYFDVIDDRHVIVYSPLRVKPAKTRGPSFVWFAQTWSLARISDQTDGPDDAAGCCHYGASRAGASMGKLWLSHFPSGDNLAWFAPDSGQRRDYLRVTRVLPRPGSSYSFTRAPLNVKV